MLSDIPAGKKNKNKSFWKAKLGNSFEVTCKKKEKKIWIVQSHDATTAVCWINLFRLDSHSLLTGPGWPTCFFHCSIFGKCWTTTPTKLVVDAGSCSPTIAEDIRQGKGRHKRYFEARSLRLRPPPSYNRASAEGTCVYGLCLKSGEFHQISTGEGWAESLGKIPW